MAIFRRRGHQQQLSKQCPPKNLTTNNKQLSWAAVSVRVHFRSGVPPSAAITAAESRIKRSMPRRSRKPPDPSDPCTLPASLRSISTEQLQPHQTGRASSGTMVKNPNEEMILEGKGKWTKVRNSLLSAEMAKDERFLQGKGAEALQQTQKGPRDKDSTWHLYSGDSPPMSPQGNTAAGSHQSVSTPSAAKGQDSTGVSEEMVMKGKGKWTRGRNARLFGRTTAARTDEESSPEPCEPALEDTSVFIQVGP